LVSRILSVVNELTNRQLERLASAVERIKVLDRLSFALDIWALSSWHVDGDGIFSTVSVGALEFD
jgi:hypothetical protein